MFPRFVHVEKQIYLFLFLIMNGSGNTFAEISSFLILNGVGEHVRELLLISEFYLYSQKMFIVCY